MSKTFVIGDIHGGLKALKQVLQRAVVNHSDKLIFLGDYTDGWSESAAVLDWLIQLSETQSCIFIKGNHDVWTEDWLRTGHTDSTWLQHGGAATIDSYVGYTSLVKQQHLQFLERMPFYYIDAQNRLFIHAGFTSMHGPQKEFHSSNFSWDRTLWEMAVTMDRRIKKSSPVFPQRLKLFTEIYIGHTPTLYYGIAVPMNGCNVWNVDTGAAFTGKLTVMNIDSKEFWQSDPVKNLYPGEAGRNKD